MRKLIILGQLCHPIFVYSCSSWRYQTKPPTAKIWWKHPIFGNQLINLSTAGLGRSRWNHRLTYSTKNFVPFPYPGEKRERDGLQREGRGGGGIGKMGECTLYSVQCSEERERAAGGGGRRKREQGRLNLNCSIVLVEGMEGMMVYLVGTFYIIYFTKARKKEKV